MTFDQTIVFTTLVAALVLVVWGRWRYDLVALGALLALALVRIVPAEEAFLGFGHPAVITVATVLVASRGLQNAGVVDLLAGWGMHASGNTTGFGMFDFAPVGGGVAVAGILFLALAGWRLIPQRKARASREELFEIEAYTTEVRVPESSKILGHFARHAGRAGRKRRPDHRRPDPRRAAHAGALGFRAAARRRRTAAAGARRAIQDVLGAFGLQPLAEARPALGPSAATDAGPRPVWRGDRADHAARAATGDRLHARRRGDGAHRPAHAPRILPGD